MEPALNAMKRAPELLQKKRMKNYYSSALSFKDVAELLFMKNGINQNL